MKAIMIACLTAACMNTSHGYVRTWNVGIRGTIETKTMTTDPVLCFIRTNETYPVDPGDGHSVLELMKPRGANRVAYHSYGGWRYIWIDCPGVDVEIIQGKHDRGSAAPAGWASVTDMGEIGLGERKTVRIPADFPDTFPGVATVSVDAPSNVSVDLTVGSNLDISGSVIGVSAGVFVIRGTILLTNQ